MYQPFSSFASAQQGMTLLELMISMTLGVIILLGLSGLLFSSSASYLLQDQQAQVQETGRYALDVLTRAVRQAGYRDPFNIEATISPQSSVRGLDARTLQRNTPALEPASSGVVNGSDVLALRFAGDEAGGYATMFNCAGFGVPISHNEEESRGWSIFFVARDAAGEAELRCKYRTENGWNADAIARGIESFQVLYGVEVNDGSSSLSYLSASAIDALDAAAEPVDSGRGARTSSHWHKVRMVRIALLVSGAADDGNAYRQRQYDLFGSAYSAEFAAQDQGVRIVEEELPASARYRFRTVFTQTIRLRNDPAGEVW